MTETNFTKTAQPLLLNAVDAARLCGCTAKVWRHRTEYGLTPKPIKFGNRNYWRPDELAAWVAASCPRREDWDYNKSGKVRQ